MCSVSAFGPMAADSMTTESLNLAPQPTATSRQSGLSQRLECIGIFTTTALAWTQPGPSMSVPAHCPTYQLSSNFQLPLPAVLPIQYRRPVRMDGRSIVEDRRALTNLFLTHFCHPKDHPQVTGNTKVPLFHFLGRSRELKILHLARVLRPGRSQAHWRGLRAMAPTSWARRQIPPGTSTCCAIAHGPTATELISESLNSARQPTATLLRFGLLPRPGWIRITPVLVLPSTQPEQSMSVAARRVTQRSAVASRSVAPSNTVTLRYNGSLSGIAVH